MGGFCFALRLVHKVNSTQTMDLNPGMAPFFDKSQLSHHKTYQVPIGKQILSMNKQNTGSGDVYLDTIDTGRACGMCDETWTSFEAKGLQKVFIPRTCIPTGAQTVELMFTYCTDLLSTCLLQSNIKFSASSKRPCWSAQVK